MRTVRSSLEVGRRQCLIAILFRSINILISLSITNNKLKSLCTDDQIWSESLLHSHVRTMRLIYPTYIREMNEIIRVIEITSIIVRVFHAFLAIIPFIIFVLFEISLLSFFLLAFYSKQIDFLLTFFFVEYWFPFFQISF